MSDIPTKFYNDILIRLPTESLLIFRGVCKSWRQIIDNPAFIKSHIQNYKPETGLGQLLIRNERGGKLLSLSLDFIEFGNHHHDIEMSQVKNLVGRGLPRLATLPVAICNGLILIPHTEPQNASAPKKLWVLWNPLTQEYYQLPQCEADRHLCGFGLGYDSTNDDYKVVRINEISCNGKLVYKTLVYSLRSDSWERIEDCPERLWWHNSYIYKNGKYLNGVLYWLSKDSVVALDLSTGRYSKFAMPTLRYEQPEYTINWVMNLDALSGCLLFSCNYVKPNYQCDEHNFNGYEGWVMNDDDGGEIKWDKLFSLTEVLEDSIGTWTYLDRCWKSLRPITYCMRLRSVLLQNDHTFYWLNNTNNSAKRVRIHGLRGSYDRKVSCQVWQGSIFRLGNVVAAKRIERMKKKMRAKKRVKYEITISDAGYRSASDSSYYSSSGDEDDNSSW